LSYDFYNERIVNKPRKIHQCFGCQKQMPLNKKHYHIKGKFEGEFFDLRVCFACMKHINKFREDYQDGYGLGDISCDRIDNARYWRLKRETTNSH
jgi:hypothetical protein